ncbi:proteasome accessory factor B [Motilibacter rhizosphaerae]|uniref:Proteasome accessory factor B n=1 Tax=Motilibacter rhizosphaerae TaxID=598652 RepID=A0A4Q7NB53_9ACTN|nr:WYL domain-containing protein [Motilibacter rhizosphaerae]RZS80083.1 proteasome accessory factor B [Motilibacter rhizosphaerae]
MASASPSRGKTERLLNLLLALLATRRPLTKQELRRLVPGYPDSDEAFDRSFERDKDELRELGVPVETGSVSGTDLFADEVGYRVRREAYALPEVAFTPEELTVLALAARAWQSAALSGPASRALLKLQASGAGVDDAAVAGIEPRVSSSEPALLPLWQALRDRRPVRFAYRRGSAGEATTRTVEPWGVVARAGRWYLVGHDRDRSAPRVFRLSRITGAVRPLGRPGEVEVPADVDLQAAVAAVSPQAGAGTAHVRLSPGSGGWLRRSSTATADPDVVAVGYSDPDLLAAELVALGPAAVVLDPPEVREAVARRLAAVAAAHAGAAT